MKKIYSFIVLLMLFCVTTSNAQRQWNLANESTAEIKSGLDHEYVLQEGFNTGGWSNNGYLNSGDGDVVTNVDVSCIYSFIEVDEKVVNDVAYKVYVLYNHGNGKYLSGGDNKYVRGKGQAFKFTARKAHEFAKGEGNYEDWEDYSHACEAERSPGAEAAGAWILCSTEQRLYIGFGANPSWWNYTDTNNWLILEATEREVPAFEKLSLVFDKEFVVPVDSVHYPVGTNPGCVSQDLFDQLLASYEQGVAITGKGASASDEECDKARLDILAAKERYHKEVVQVHSGYYLVVNMRSMDAMYDAGDIARCKLGLAKPEAWTLENTKYIWNIHETANGKFYFQNWGTGKFIGQTPGTSSPNPMVADSTVQISTKQFEGIWFRMHDGKMWMHNDGGGKVVGWNSEGTGNRFRFEAVPADTIDSLSVLVEQNMLNKKLSKLVGEANSDYKGLETKSGLTFDGTYLSSAKGLVTEFEAANATETREGKPEWAFDGNLGTYYHTLWDNTKAPQDDWHWVQVDLGKEVSELYMKFSKRKNNQNGNPTRIALVAAEGDELEAPVWSDTLFKDTVIYEYASMYGGVSVDSTTCIKQVQLSRPAQHIRFAVTRTQLNSIYGYGPCWHVSELRFYDAADCVANPLLAMVPQEIKDALTAAIAKANAELDNNAATQESYDALETALKAFWEAYPDPSGLQDALDAAQEVHDAAEEGEELGFFAEGAKAELQTAIEAIRAKIADKLLTLDEIKAFDKELDAALAAFNAKLNAPEANKVYRIVSASQPNDDGSEKAQNSALVASVDADLVNGTPVWGYKEYEDAAERFNTLWLLEKSEKGYAFKNLANGLYINNVYDGLTEEEVENLEEENRNLGYSNTPKYFQLESGVEPGTFLISLYESQYMNMQPTGYMVHYNVRTDAHAPMKFVEVFDEDYSTSWKVDASAGKAQIVSFPLDLATAYTNQFAALKLVGKFDGKLQFVQYLDDEIIPAGTPFLVVTQTAEEAGGDAENFFYTELVSEDLDAVVNNTAFNYEIVNQNGLISTPSSVKLAEGFGFILDNQVVITEGGEVIPAATGYFGTEIPECESEGDFSMVLDGDITGVENVQIVKNVSNDVYTISGVKVRSNVKTSSATKGLPKGIYIVGGNKVIVK